MTEDSQGRRRGDGPLPEGAEPTEQISAQTPGNEPTAPLPPNAAPLPPDTAPFPPDTASLPPGNAPLPPDTAPLPPDTAPDAAPAFEAPAPRIPAQRSAPGADQPPYGTVQPPYRSDQPPYGSDQPPYGSDQSLHDSDQPPYGPPPSGTPISGPPISGPAARPPHIAAASDPYAFDQPVYRPDPHNDPDPYGFSAPPGRRIEPSPPPDRSRLIKGAVIGLLTGLLLFGTAGWFAGRATAPSSNPPPAQQPTTGLGVFERNQVAINEPDFAGTALTTIARGWLPYLATCTRNGNPGGPALGEGEKSRVRCTLDGMSAIFVEYDSIGARDEGRRRTVGRLQDAEGLAPGVAPAGERRAPSGRTEGNYVEYAYRLTESGTTRTVSGIWWDDERTPVAGYLLAYWKDGVGESWEPMRDLWSRYA